MTLTSRARFFALSALCLAFLSGCQTMKKMEWPKFDTDKKVAADNCPVIGISPDLGMVTQTRGGEVLSDTVISSVKPECSVQDSMATIRLALEFKGRLEPAGMKDTKVEANYSIPYLLAVIDPQGQIISKDIFSISMIYKAGQTEQVFPDLIEQSIPLKQGESPSGYKIMVGFQLSEDELAYNRAHAAK